MGAVCAFGVSCRNRVRERGDRFLLRHFVGSFVQQYARNSSAYGVIHGRANRGEHRGC